MAQLSEQQKYLLERLPRIHSFKNNVVPDTPEVKQARKVIASFAEKVDRNNSERKDKFSKMLIAAKESIYFKPAGDALSAVRAVEAEFPEVVK